MSKSDENDSNSQGRQKITPSITNYYSSSSEEENSAVENCRGQGHPKKQKRFNYLNINRNILFDNENSKTKSHVIGILKNGNHLGLKSVRQNAIEYTVTNTCAFDSIV